MLQGRLTAALVALALAGMACSGADDEAAGPIEENVVAPGVTAIDQATAAVCEREADNLRRLLDEFEVIEGAPAESESALVATGYLTEESELFDVVDGRLEAVTPACKSAVPVTAPSGSAPLTAPATEVGQIVTDEQLLSADEVFGAMTDDDVTAFGGEACARELADILAAAERYLAREGANPTSLDDLADDLEREVNLWELDPTGAFLVPAPGSPCPDVFSQG